MRPFVGAEERVQKWTAMSSGTSTRQSTDCEYLRDDMMYPERERSSAAQSEPEPARATCAAVLCGCIRAQTFEPASPSTLAPHNQAPRPRSDTIWTQTTITAAPRRRRGVPMLSLPREGYAGTLAAMAESRCLSSEMSCRRAGFSCEDVGAG
ncbi:hypothetical protein BC628DRAFT_470213 [Trametes gibbosa]|nr:hypothetical protein BC628DRAFT_470213 [Trametes gibbosa]